MIEILALNKIVVTINPEVWDIIVKIKHPVMKDEIKNVCLTLECPDEIRVSNSDQNVFLFYKLIKEKRWICVVIKVVDPLKGFLITTYPTDKIKEGTIIWKK